MSDPFQTYSFNNITPHLNISIYCVFHSVKTQIESIIVKFFTRHPDVYERPVSDNADVGKSGIAGTRLSH